MSRAASPYWTRFWVPMAQEVAFDSDFGRYPLHSDDGQHWQASIDVPRGSHEYRFVIDGAWSAPDPFNARYRFYNGQYRSVIDAEGTVDMFTEAPVRLCCTDGIPKAGLDLVPASNFGPRNRQVCGVLDVQGLARAENHAVWVWRSPKGRTWALQGVVSQATDRLFCAIRYEDFTDFGNWALSAFVNGRFCGQVRFSVQPVRYSAALRLSPVSANA